MVAGLLLRRALWLPAVSAGLAATATRYYLTHPQRVAAELPADLAAAAQHIRLRGCDGSSLHAIWIAAGAGEQPGTTQPDRTIVHLHGYNGSAGLLLSHVLPIRRAPVQLSGGSSKMTLFAWPLVRAGLARAYNWLLVDIRGHGQSAGRWDTTGRLAVADAMAWAKWLREEHGQLWVGLWGNSFGASLGLALAVKASGGGFDAMVLDSPAVTAKGLYAGLVHKPAYWAIQPVLTQLSNRRLLDELAAAHVWMPIRLIHGEADRHVPAWQSQRVYDLIYDPAQPERSSLWLVSDADHLEALAVVPEAYLEQTLGWFDQWLGGSS